MKKKFIVILVLLFIMILISGCIGILTTSGEDSIAPGKGRHEIYLTDSSEKYKANDSENYLAVYITISKIQVHLAGEDEEAEGEWIEWELFEPTEYNLIGLKDVFELLIEGELSYGKYTQIRLFVINASVDIESGESGVPVEIPSVYQTGIKLIHPFEIIEGEITELTIDFNAEKSIVETGNGKMYITISDDNGKPVEVFLFLGKSGQILNTFTEALGRLFSLALQQGVPVSKLTKTLRGINSDSPVWHKFEPTDTKPTQILSIPDAIAKLLDKYYLNVRDFSNGGSSDQICPKCGLNMSAQEGCFSCTCGHSKCS